MLRLFLIAILACFLLEACNSFYATALPYQPRLDGKNNLHASLNRGAGGFNIGVAYSPVNHVFIGGVMHAYSKGSAHHESGGPIVGLYHNSPDSNFHVSVLGGYQWGDVLESHLKIQGFAAYEGWQGQLYVSHRVGKRRIRNLSLGVNIGSADFRYSRMHYTYNGPDSLFTSATVASIVFQFGRRFPKLEGFAYHAQIGFSTSPSAFANYSEYYMYQGVVLRLGISYQFHPFRKKQT